MANILLSTFGGTWAIAAELVSVFSPNKFDQFNNNSNIKYFQDKLISSGFNQLDELWLICTHGSYTDKALKEFERWKSFFNEDDSPKCRYLSLDKLEDLTTEDECKLMSDFIYRAVLHANKYKENGKLILSLTGGRKTMSTDMQRAADLFGCDMLIHLADNNLRFNVAEEFISELPKKEADKLFVVEVETDKSKSFIIEMEPEILSENYLINFNRNNLLQTNLYDEVSKRLKTSEFVHYNAYKSRTNKGLQAMFYGLQQLSPDLIKELEFSKPSLEWLKSLPKTDLHCHFGGILDSQETIEVALSNINKISLYLSNNSQFKQWYDEIQYLIENKDFDKLHSYVVDKNKLRNTLFPDIPEPIVVSTFLSAFKNNSEFLDRVIFAEYQNEDLYRNIGIVNYEKLGDLQGSALLQSKESITKACEILLEQCKEQNLKYLELRCSPCNYTRSGLSGREVVETMHKVLSKQNHCDIRLIIIGSRHGDRDVFKQHVSLSLELLKDKKYHDFIVGFDVAGNESIATPSELREMMLPLLKECLHITIHAGEDQPVENIWEAVYELNTDRVGHGLTLVDNDVLLKRFRDRNIFIELCPSSNFQICDYRREIKEYPLREYLSKGLKVTINTDNPGISRTTITDEYKFVTDYANLNRLEILQLIRNSFQAVFLPKDEKKKLLFDIETELIKLITN